MAQRQMYASMGALRRSLGADVASVQACSSRALHSSARRLEEQPSDASPAQPPNSRRVRSATALKQIASLQYRRQPGALARGSFPSGQMLQRTPRSPTTQANEYGFIPEDSAPANTQQDASARAARNTAGPRTTRGSAPPQGQMVRAPSTLRMSRPAPGGATRGPNLRGRDARRPATGGKRSTAGNNRGEAGPKRREKTSGGDETMSTKLADVELGDTISDAMTQQLLRLQRKEWDRVPYEPKYAKGSFAANELIHAGRELFKGESPPVKIWGPLEKRIGVVGMFGAEARLKVRRVLDGDAEPFGQEVIEEAEPVEVKGVEKKETVVQ
ncbi:hypothetical protein COCSADRAFT_161853 [Bipolaris sorokiniana ND90Pr]|uniref:Uncharacterized protein n=1 Tax=Cochliobolus sativus (strain ND90Pr / ATCC 201652) TaxID=665912 RepID=M2R8S5_COCSN|nr:uncharacterized protein COCSADRAFT_161853 [Bipolaris sorokiniana ND90Pr]EMD63349.1 hypothetical protein COCSADRAFT_161853 [Bipolaris sorokiniana ND90Pr]